MLHISNIFFQAEDGIRDGHVTGVQTCALPIFTLSANGEVMILAFSEEAGENTDLYVSFRVNQDIYSSPIRLEGVNSEFREFSPSLSEDGRLLFFSSKIGRASCRESGSINIVA